MLGEILPSDKIYVSNSNIPDAGRGVFAYADIQEGELIERCPVIEVSLIDPANNDDDGILTDYFFYFGDGLAVALGYGSIYNHSYVPNATYEKKVEEKLIEFTAIRDIRKGEEITVNYNFGDPDDKSKPQNKGIPTFDG